jgi:uncharacterized SAM-binding protein YcdF (DUF218 family)
MQGLLTALLLPPLLLALAILALGVMAARGWRGAGWLAAAAALAILALATPYAAGTLRAGLEAAIPTPPPGPAAGAIVILGGDSIGAAGGATPGPLTLERLRAGAALHRATGLPILVTGGPVGAGQAPIAEIMARSLAEDFRVPVRWVEPAARDTRGNAERSAALLREAGVGAAHVVTHGWHMPRSLEAFARAGFPAHPAPLPDQGPPTGIWTDFAPRPDFLAQSWFMLREWAGRLVYAWRDG